MGVASGVASRWLLALTGLVIAAAGVAAPAPASARQEVAFTGYPAGTVVVKTSQRKLYYVTGDGRAIVYPVAVGRPGKQWAGHAYIASKQVRPAWSPPAEVLADKPWLPRVVPPGPKNPLGAAALLLSRGEYAIHGTNTPSSIGTFASYGCIRMFNEHVVDLYSRVSVGTPVVVTP